MKAEDTKRIEAIAGELDGIFRLQDLRVLFSGLSSPGLYKKLNTLVDGGLLVKVMRGLYALPTASLEQISRRITPDSYISTATVLAGHLLIGSIPARRVQAVKVGRPLTVTCPIGTIEFLGVKPELYFGFEEKGGVRRALPEKAFLDACYFHFKGRRFSFDLVEDVDLAALNPARIRTFLEAYDRRFVTFFKRTWRFP